MQERSEVQSHNQAVDEGRTFSFKEAKKIINQSDLLSPQKTRLISAFENFLRPENEREENEEIEFLQNLKESLDMALGNIRGYANLRVPEILNEVFRSQFDVNIADLTPFERGRLNDTLSNFGIGLGWGEALEQHPDLEDLESAVEKIDKRLTDLKSD